MTMMRLVFGLVPESLEEATFLEHHVGSFKDVPTALIDRGPVKDVTETQRWLGMWAYEHAATSYPWRREQTRRRLAAMQQRLDGVSWRGL